MRDSHDERVNRLAAFLVIFLNATADAHRSHTREAQSSKQAAVHVLGRGTRESWGSVAHLFATRLELDTRLPDRRDLW